jgi:alkanesulfonate monooxygenase SsuD/methylene tetrahydromethanopterin reductase-like flavin-dependent oxidoreductase (luciferase family)
MPSSRLRLVDDQLRGFGAKSEFWDHNLESFTLIAGLAAVTSRIKLFATVPPLLSRRRSPHACAQPSIRSRMGDLASL